MASAPLASFPQFAELPMELRTKIFEEAVLLFPRIVEICQLRPEWKDAAGGRSSTMSDEEDNISMASQPISPSTGPESNSSQTVIESPRNEDSAVPELREAQILESEAVLPTKSTAESAGGGSEPTTSEAAVADSIRNDDSSSSDSDGHDEHNSDSETDDEDIPPISNPHPFYSPTALPPIFHINSESRQVALRHYPLSFPNADLHPATIRFNFSIDTLFFPAWCFEYSIDYFEFVCPKIVKDSIRKLAFENLVWYSSWNDGSINCQVQISDYRDVEEILMVQRRPGPSGCGCCHDFEAAERGAVSFQSNESDEGQVLSADQRIVKGEVLDSKRHLAGWKNYTQKRLGDLQEAFDAIEASDPNWKRPRIVRFVHLMRDGEVV